MISAKETEYAMIAEKKNRTGNVQTSKVKPSKLWGSHQFGLTEQVAILHIPGNQQFTIFLVAR